MIAFITSHVLGKAGGGSLASSGYFKAFEVLFPKALVLYSPLYGGDEAVEITRPGEPTRTAYTPRALHIADVALARGRAVRSALKDIREGSLCPRLIVLDGSLAIGATAELSKYASIIAIHHNVEADYWKDNGANWPKRMIYGFLTTRAQKAAWKNAALNLTLTKADAIKLTNMFGPTSYKVGGVGIEATACPVFPRERTAEAIAITGNFSVPKSRKALLDALGIIGRAKPINLTKLSFVVAGREASKIQQAAQRNLAAAGHVLQCVESPKEIDKVIGQCGIYWSPSFHGSGIKVRMTDGLRNGQFLLCRKENVAGYEQFDGVFLKTYKQADEAYGCLLECISRLREWGLENSFKQITDIYTSSFTTAALVERLKHMQFFYPRFASSILLREMAESYKDPNPQAR